MERTFLITIIEHRHIKVDGQIIIKGETLYKAILSQLIETGGHFLWWDSEILGSDSTPEEKAVSALTLIESGDCCDYDIHVSDMTDIKNIFTIFPTDERPNDFDPFIIGKSFFINCWIPAYDKPEDRPEYTSMIEAQQELDQLQMMQPENIYRIEGE